MPSSINRRSFLRVAGLGSAAVDPLKNIDVDDLSLDQIELVEKLSLRLAFQALVWFAPQAWDIFERSPDDPQDIAEDATRQPASVRHP